MDQYGKTFALKREDRELHQFLCETGTLGDVLTKKDTFELYCQLLRKNNLSRNHLRKALIKLLRAEGKYICYFPTNERALTRHLDSGWNADNLHWKSSCQRTKKQFLDLFTEKYLRDQVAAMQQHVKQRGSGGDGAFHQKIGPRALDVINDVFRLSVTEKLPIDALTSHPQVLMMLTEPKAVTAFYKFVALARRPKPSTAFIPEAEFEELYVSSDEQALIPLLLRLEKMLPEAQQSRGACLTLDETTIRKWAKKKLPESGELHSVGSVIQRMRQGDNAVLRRLPAQLKTLVHLYQAVCIIYQHFLKHINPETNKVENAVKGSQLILRPAIKRRPKITQTKTKKWCFRCGIWKQHSAFTPKKGHCKACNVYVTRYSVSRVAWESLTFYVEVLMRTSGSINGRPVPLQDSFQKQYQSPSSHLVDPCLKLPSTLDAVYQSTPTTTVASILNLCSISD